MLIFSTKSDLEKPFDEIMLDVMNKAALALMLSVGHRTKLFDAMAKLPPSTSNEIASAANLNERYVREWLGALVTSKIIDYNPISSLYSLAFIGKERNSS